MATYALTAGQHGAYAKTLVASTVDTVTFVDDLSHVEVYGDGTSAIYVTVDGTTPTVGGASTWELPTGAAATRTITTTDRSGATITVKLISAGTPSYSVSAGDP